MPPVTLPHATQNTAKKPAPFKSSHTSVIPAAQDAETSKPRSRPAPAATPHPLHRRGAWLLIGIYMVATVQFVWCYLWITRPYVNTLLYEHGRERMPFQGRCLMILPLRLAHNSAFLGAFGKLFAISRFWFPKPVQPEVLVQAVVGVACLLVTGLLTTKIYQAASRHRLLTPFIYPLLLVVCGATYVMHTTQNFRFIYDLPSLAFFSTAFYLIYFRRHRAWLFALFLVATVNRETTLLLLPLILIDTAFHKGTWNWRRTLRPQTLLFVSTLCALWIGWELLVRHIFAANPSEFYPRINWNVKSLLVPQAWPQLISACGFLLPLVLLGRKRIPDSRLRAWLWLFPFWVAFMFCYGILIETRVFGELIPLVVCASALILEELLAARMTLALPSIGPKRSLPSSQTPSSEDSMSQEERVA